MPVRYRVKVLDRAIAILEILAAAEDDLGPSEIAIRLRLHKSTIHRLLMALERHRFIRRSQGKYALGMKLFELGHRAVGQLNLSERARPVLRALAAETGETAHVCVLSGNEMLSITNVEGAWRIRTPATVGRRTQIHCTAVGKALLAFLPDEKRAELMPTLTFRRFTRNTITRPAALRAELASIRSRGFAIDNEEIEAGLRCIAAPVFDHTGRAVASLGIAGPVFRLKKERLSALARTVMAAAQALSVAIGFQESGPMYRRLAPRV